MNSLPTNNYPFQAAIIDNGTLSDEDARIARENFLRQYRLRSSNEGRLRSIGFAAPLVLAAAILLVFLSWPANTLDYEASGAHQEDGYILAPDEHPAILTFSDKTVVKAAARS